jgi:uncharacterized protein YndB with AHSA1/START domain
MTVVDSRKDVQGLTLTFVTEFNASVDRVWQVWQDPRQLERWWGPPGWPATFERHEFVVGGQTRYYMTGPKGEKSHGWWTITAIEAPRRLEFDDGFAGEDGEPLDPTDSTHAIVTLEPIGAGTRMTVLSKFANTKQMEQMLDMGAEEGMRQALSQIDGLLAEGAR